MAEVEWGEVPKGMPVFPLTTSRFHGGKRKQAKYLEKIRNKNLKMGNLDKFDFIHSEYCPAFIPHAEKTRWHGTIEEDCGNQKDKQHSFSLQGDSSYGFRFRCKECGKCLSISISNALAYEMTKAGFITEGVEIKSPEEIQKEKENEREIKRLERLKVARGHERVMLSRTTSWVEYNLYMNSPEWKAKRKAILQWHNYTCRLCGFRSKKIKEVFLHHSTYERLGNEKPEDLIPVCNPCHELFHFGTLSPSADTSTNKEVLFCG